MKTKIFVLIIVWHFGIDLYRAQTTGSLNEKVKYKIDSTYNALIKKYKVAGMSLAIVDNGEVVYATGYGFADLENKIKANEKTIYRIGSCTKSFTSLALLQLQERGVLKINNSVKNYLPELTIISRFNDNNQFLIGDMLCHVSALPSDIINGFFCDAPPNINWVINELNKQTTISPVRYKHAYSNVAYGLLGEVIARTGKTSYSDYLKQNIFKPLNMTSSYVEEDPQLAPLYAKGYVNAKLIKEPLIRDQAAGLIHSNVLDMANYIIMYLNNGKFQSNQIVSPETVADMEANHISNITLSNGENWGYGLYSAPVFIKKDKDSTEATIIGHGGDTFAYHADFGFIPELNVGVVLLTNSDNGRYVRSMQKLLKLYVKEAKGKTISTNPAKGKADEVEVNKGSNISQAERKGSYNFGSFVMNVRNPVKIKFKQGPAVIVLKQKSDTNIYKVKARVFGFIPFNVGNQEFRFAKFNDKIYAKSIDPKTGEEEFECEKSGDRKISDAWLTKLGEYKVVNKVYECKDCVYGDTEGINMNLGISHNNLFLNIKAKGPDISRLIFIEEISDKLCVTGGIGRGTGQSVAVLENGNIYYDGFEFKKVK